MLITLKQAESVSGCYRYSQTATVRMFSLNQCPRGHLPRSPAAFDYLVANAIMRMLKLSN